jgi:hypothetical protein
MIKKGLSASCPKNKFAFLNQNFGSFILINSCEQLPLGIH